MELGKPAEVAVKATKRRLVIGNTQQTDGLLIISTFYDKRVKPNASRLRLYGRL